jgi:hypothetical protein
VKRRVARVAGVLAGYLAVLAWLTWPLAAHLTTHLPYTKNVSQTDVPYIAWTLAWQSHALATDPAHYVDANIYHPARETLFYGDPGIGALPLFAPVYLATGNPTLAINVVFLGGLALTATALHLVVGRWTGDALAGVVAVATLLTNPALMWQFLPWAPSYAVLLWFPCIMWLAARPARGVGAVVGRGVLVALQAAANLVYLAIAVVGPLAVLALARAGRRATRADGLRLAASVAVALGLLAPMYVGYARVLAENPGVRDQSRWKAEHVEVPDVLRPFVVSVGDVVRPVLVMPNALFERPRVLRLALPTIVLVVGGALVAWLGRRGKGGPPASAWQHGALWVVVGLVLATPVGALPDRPVVALPHYVALAWIAPALQRAIRDPDRIAMASLMGWALLAGAAFAALTAALPARGRRIGATGLAALVVVVLAFDGGMAGSEYPLWQPPDGSSPVIARIRALGGPVLDLPLGPTGTTPLNHARAMYRSIYHWQPILNGYASYWPAGFEQRMAVAQQVPSPAAVDALRREAGLKLVLVEIHSLGLPDRPRWLGIADAGGTGSLRLVARDEMLLLFQVEDPT